VRIAINTRFLLKNKLEGLGVYTLEITKRLALANPDHTFILLFDRSYDPEYVFAENCIPVVAGPQARHPFLWYAWFENTLPRILKKYKADVFFSPDGYASLRSDVPTLLTVHDLAFEHYPKDIGKLVSKFYRYYTPKYLQKATRIITPSEFTKQDLIEHYAVNQDKITTIFNGVSNHFYKLNDYELDLNVEKKEYFLYAGSLHPRKNIANLLRSFDQFKEESGSPKKLVIVGRKAWSTTDMEKVFAAMKWKKDVVFTGKVEDGQLNTLYNGAFALLYISYFEGFGLPVAESMKVGTPAIVSNRSSLPEVGQDGALHVNPFDPNEVAKAMKRLDHNPDLYAELADKASKVGQQYSWDHTAKQVWEQICKVYDAV
jgi:glycosyltransferase involved in cell wall biosynthesis